mgnify:FL=1
MNIAKIVPYDVANGPGIRMSIWVSGCRRHCPGCFNPEAQDFEYGQPVTDKMLGTITAYAKSQNHDGFNFLGGEPFEKENEPMLCVIAHDIKQHRQSIAQDIWCWTGYTWEELMDDCRRGHMHMLLKDIDVLVDGPFIEEKKDISLLWRGSSNQRIIDVRKSFEADRLVLYGSLK